MSNKFEVMILTYNRKQYLQQSLESVLKSTYNDFNITILDNASTDGTEELIRDFQKKYSNIRYLRNEKPNNTSFGNTKKAINEATADYLMIFHDDDILHCQYLEYVKTILEKYDNVDLICSGKNRFTEDSGIKQGCYDSVHCMEFDNKSDFVALTFINKDGKDLVFPNVVYKTTYAKELLKTFDGSLYGKIGDKPLVLSCVNDGKVFYIKEPMLNYRIHKGQDSNTNVNGPFDNQILNFLAYYKNLLSSNKSLSFLYEVHSFYWLRSLNRWGYGIRNIKILAQKALEQGLISKYTYNVCVSRCSLFFRLVNHMLKKIIVKAKYKTIEIKRRDI